MTISEYIKKSGLKSSLVAQQMGVSRQAVEQYGDGTREPTARTLKRLAAAMTELGAPTTVVELVRALYDAAEE